MAQDEAPGVHRSPRPRASKVLFVHPEPEQLNELERRVREHLPALEVVTADSGKDALLKTGFYRPDALVMDIGLRDLSVAQVIGTVRWHPALRQTAILVLAANWSRDELAQMEAAGADACLTTPWLVEKLMLFVPSVSTDAGLDGLLRPPRSKFPVN